MKRFYFLAAGVIALACVAKAPSLESGLRATSSGVATAPSQPLAEPSEEATLDQLLLARDQGRSVGDALVYWLASAARGGKTVSAGELSLSVALLPVPGAATPGPAQLAVVARDGADGRLVPGLSLDAVVLDASGRRILAGPLGYVCDPLLDHYGAMFTADSAGPYTVKLDVSPLALRRHDPLNGDRFRERVFAELRGLSLAPFAVADTMRQQSLARAQGMAIERALDAMSNGVAVDGGETRAGDYLIDYAVEYAEGLWCSAHGELTYRSEVNQSAERNAHVEVAVRDAATGRLLPNVGVTATLSRGGEIVGTRRQALMWHPWLHHYGENWRVPGSGKYELDVRVEPASCTDSSGNARLVPSAPLQAHFEGVEIRTGQK